MPAPHREPWPALNEIAMEMFGPVRVGAVPNTSPDLIEAALSEIRGAGDIALSQVQIGFGRRTLSDTPEHGKLVMHFWNEAITADEGPNEVPYHTHGSEIDSVVLGGVIRDSQYVWAPAPEDEGTHRVYSAEQDARSVVLSATDNTGILTDEEEREVEIGETYKVAQGRLHRTEFASALTLVRFGARTGEPFAVGAADKASRYEFERESPTIDTDALMRELLAQ